MSKTSRSTSRYVSRMIGNEPYWLATASRSAERWRCIHRGVRCPGRRRGRRSARAAFSRKRAAKSAEPPSSAVSRSSISSGSNSRAPSIVEPSLSTPSGRRTAIPSSDQIDWTSMPCCSRSRASIAIDHGAWTRPPNGVSMTTRQSPSSSRKRSTTIVRSVGKHAGDLALVAEIGDEVLGGELVHGVRVAQPRHRLRRLHRLQLAQEGTDRAAQLDRPPDRVAVPERHLAGLTRSRRDDHPVRADLLDPPGRGPEQERLPDPGLVHHLLVELADPAAAPPGVVSRQEDAEEPAVRDRAAARDRDDARVVAADDLIGLAVPDDPRLEIGELVGGVAAGEHVEHALQLLARQVAEAVRAGDEPVQVAHRPAVEGADRDELLGEDVERVPGNAGLLDRRGLHPLDDDRRLEQVAAVLREDLADARLADLVAGATDALHPRGDRRRGLDLDDEVDRPHVDAELEAARGDERREPARPSGPPRSGAAARERRCRDAPARAPRRRARSGAPPAAPPAAGC